MTTASMALSIRLFLLDVLLEDRANRPGTFLGDSLLVVLVVDVSHAEPGLVAFGPFEVTAIAPISNC